MKAQELAPIVHSMALATQQPQRDVLLELESVLKEAKSTTIAALHKKLSKLPISELPGSPSSAALVEALAPMLALLDAAGKPAVAKDLRVLFSLFALAPSSSASALLGAWHSELARPTATKPTAKQEVVDRHVSALEGALGNDPEFRLACQRIDADGDVGPLEISAISQHVVMQKIKSKAAALKKIWARHHSVMASKSKLETRDGRSAA